MTQQIPASSEKSAHICCVLC